MPIEINADDVDLAENFLETLLTENIPEGRFTRGSALRDLTVKALAFAFAHIQKENEEIRSLQSLLNVENIAIADPDTDRAVSNAVDAILSNWFLSRKSGNFARGVVLVNVSKRQDYIVPGNNRFLYDRTRAFFPDVTDPSQNIIVRANELIPILSLDGTVEGYQFRQRVVAARTGEEFNVEASTWQGGRDFSPFVTAIFSDEIFSGGGGKESTDTLIDRSSNAIAVRNLINPRSIDATLREKFSFLTRLFVSGMGDAEMIRDRKIETASGIDLHVGGHFDVYMELPRVETTFEGQLGGQYLRPDGVPNVFRDTTNVLDWTAENVQLGDILRITDGLPNSPRDFVIKEIFSTELRVSENTPFEDATDDLGTFVDYFIFRPIFGPDVQILPTVGVNTTGQTSKRVQTPNRLVLPGGAHYDVLDVEIIDPDPGDSFISATDGHIHFPVRVNTTPNATTSSTELEYQITNSAPGNAQSEIQLEEVVLDSAFNNKTLRVTYETLSGLNTVHSFARDRFERILAANVLPKGLNPVYLTARIPFRHKPNATDTIDTTALRQAITTFINTFDPTDIIDVSDLSQVVRDFSPLIGAVLPFNITYKLITPDGRIIRFSTSDEVTIASDKISDDGVNTSLDDPLSIGISDNTIRYMTTLLRITVEDQT